MASLSSLPQELISSIAEFLDLPSVKSLAEVNKALKAAADPWLYKSVILDDQKFLLFLSALEKAPEKTEFVKSIRIDFRLDPHEPHDAPGGVAALLGRLPNLEEAFVESGAYQSEEWEALARRSLEPGEDRPFKHLRTVFVNYWSNPEESRFCYLPGAFSLFKVPSLKSLILQNFELNYETDFRRPDNLDYLGLINCDLSEEKTARLVDTCPCRSLRLYNNADDENHSTDYQAPDTGLLIASIAATRCADTIEHLIVEQLQFPYGDVDSPGVDFSPFHRMRRLDAISFGLKDVVSYRPTDPHGTFEPNLERLPKSLEVISCGDNYESPYNYTKFLAHVSALLAKRKMVPKLDRIFNYNWYSGDVDFRQYINIPDPQAGIKLYLIRGDYLLSRDTTPSEDYEDQYADNSAKSCLLL